MFQLSKQKAAKESEKELEKMRQEFLATKGVSDSYCVTAFVNFNLLAVP